MPATSRKKPKTYLESDMVRAMELMKAGMSVRAASRACNVPKSTLMDRSSGTHGDGRGRPSELTPEEEDKIIEMAELLGEWGFPFTKNDLRQFVKSYLDKKGVKTRFVDNLPTKRFVDTFIGRHPQFTLRKTNPIKRTRAAVSREQVEEFFTNFKKSMEGVPPENLFNFDESYLRDDPGTSKCIFKKGTKYCEKVQNTSKSSISIMFCGSQAGEWVPPMVLYKALNLYTSWCQRGPKGTTYSCSKSGWFDMFQFQLWFEDLLLPRLKKRPGKKLIIGDNLASHISPRVIELCKLNNIQFVCLPPNSTDKLQPLDVGVFAPLKAAWRTVLTEYKARDTIPVLKIIGTCA
jgi:hypothetical protein